MCRYGGFCLSSVADVIDSQSSETKEKRSPLWVAVPVGGLFSMRFAEDFNHFDLIFHPWPSRKETSANSS